MRPRGLTGTARGSRARGTRGAKTGYTPPGPRAGNGDQLPPLPGAQRTRKPPSASCACERKILPTTFEDIAAGISPRCPKCPQEGSP